MIFGVKQENTLQATPKQIENAWADRKQKLKQHQKQEETFYTVSKTENNVNNVTKNLQFQYYTKFILYTTISFFKFLHFKTQF